MFPCTYFHCSAKSQPFNTSEANMFIFILPLFKFSITNTQSTKTNPFIPPPHLPPTNTFQIPHLTDVKETRVTEHTSKIITLVYLKHSTAHWDFHPCVQIAKKKKSNVILQLFFLCFSVISGNRQQYYTFTVNSSYQIVNFLHTFTEYLWISILYLVTAEE